MLAPDWIFCNKLFIAFESPSSPYQVLAWIRAFNEENDIKLLLYDELLNALYVVEFDIHVHPNARRDLLEHSPVKALETYATLNPYYSGFDALNPVDFMHIVTVYIPRGNPDLFLYIKFVLKPVGDHIKSRIGTGAEHHNISALVAT